jgi:hypothetical protein
VKEGSAQQDQVALLDKAQWARHLPGKAADVEELALDLEAMLQPLDRRPFFGRCEGLERGGQEDQVVFGPGFGRIDGASGRSLALGRAQLTPPNPLGLGSPAEARDSSIQQFGTAKSVLCVYGPPYGSPFMKVLAGE